MNHLKVKINGNKTGNVIYENNEYIYNYTCEEKENFISLIMPVREKGYIYKNLHPVFEMHLPEGYLLSIIKKHFSKLTRTDDFGLLKIMAPSIKGRISYESKNSIKTDSLTLDELLYPKNDKLFDELVAKFALSSALSGVQPKVLAKIENKATLKLEDYIVKSWGEDYPQLALNEYYCMKIIQESNIPVPEFYISDDEKLFILKRFDIKEDGTYLGFEDMCVLQAKQRDDKYDGTYEQIAKTIKTFVSNKYKKKNLIEFYKMTVINFLIQNGDAHLKNFGLIYDKTDNIRLAPAYDVVCTTVYIKNDIPALHLLGSKKWWNKKYLLRFGIESCSLTSKEANKYFDECENSIAKILQEIKDRLINEKNIEKIDILKRIISCFNKMLNSIKRD